MEFCFLEIFLLIINHGKNISYFGLFFYLAVVSRESLDLFFVFLNFQQRFMYFRTKMKGKNSR